MHDPAAHSAVAKAIADGDLVKPDRCEQCGKKPKRPSLLHGHHADYERPLDVEWLCPKCHKTRHPSNTESSDPGDRRRRVNLSLSEREIAALHEFNPIMARYSLAGMCRHLILSAIDYQGN